MIQYPKAYVQADEDDVLRVGDTRVMLESVVASFEEGHSAESIRCQYPALTLEEVYGAITYYLANRAEVGEYLRRQADRWEALRAAAQGQPSEVTDRLRALKQSRPS